MKFRDGMWQVAEGMHLEYAEDVHQIRRTDRGLSLLCPTKKLRNRGDTLNLSCLTIDIEAQIDGVISVETTHWAGETRKSPNFELYPDFSPPGEGDKPTPLVDPKVSESSEKGTTLSSGSLSATIHPDKHTFEIKFHSTEEDRQLTSLLDRSVGLAYTPPPTHRMLLENMRSFEHYIFTQTTLSVGESVHGLGERFGAWNKVGQQVVLWNADGGTSSEQAYKNVSFWLSSRGYGVFVDHPDRVELEVGSERSCRVQTSVEGQRLKWYIIYGPSPRDVLRRYSVLLGRAGSVPGWSFGLWLTTSFTTSYDEGTVSSFLEGMRERDIAVDVFHYDCFWMREFTWTDFVFDSDKFPDPKGQIARLKQSGLCRKVCVWINPYIAQNGAAFREAADRGYLLRRKNGDVFQWDLWQAGMGIVDFTNPEACRWYVGCLNGLFDQGVDALKTDFGERIPWRDVEWFDSQADPGRMHNYYAFMYNRVVYEALQARYGGREAVLFARSACAGTQRFPLTWGGDCESTPEAMAESVRGGLSLGLAGHAFWSVDIGGFEGHPRPWVYKRWVAFGLLCSHSRLHGSGSYRVPWTIDGDDRTDQGCSRTLARWTRIKNRLMPYLFSQARAAVLGGLPLSLRAFLLEFPDDPTSWFLDRQFMVGDSLMAAPVFDEGGEVQFYLPRGRWTCFFTGRTRDGPGWFRERHGFGTLPLYVRPGTVLPLRRRDLEVGEGKGKGVKGAVYDYSEHVEVRLYEVKAGDRAEIVGSDGELVGTLRVGEDGQTVEGLDILKGDYVVREVGFTDESAEESGIELLE